MEDHVEGRVRGWWCGERGGGGGTLAACAINGWSEGGNLRGKRLNSLQKTTKNKTTKHFKPEPI